MAANEHKNLSDINRHNPKGFENATNDTILSKGAGTSPTGTDGNLIWIPKSIIKTSTVSMIGYTVGNGSVYKFRNQISDGQAPFEVGTSYGSGTVGALDFDVSNIFRTANYLAQDDCNVTKITGWISGNSAAVVTVAICKVTPVNGSSSDITPVLIDEFTATGAGNDIIIKINETTFTESSISEGDFVFPMVKGGSGQVIYFNVTLELGYDN
tara:strand:+ start:148 stop:783 length:636 start_codon:yes stop_codon:yes gene_type:complete